MAIDLRKQRVSFGQWQESENLGWTSLSTGVLATKSITAVLGSLDRITNDVYDQDIYIIGNNTTLYKYNPYYHWILGSLDRITPLLFKKSELPITHN